MLSVIVSPSVIGNTEFIILLKVGSEMGFLPVHPSKKERASEDFIDLILVG